MERVRASLILAALGDAIGYKNGEYEFNREGTEILDDVKKLGGLSKIDLKGWLVSDDTVMHLATARAIESPKDEKDLEEIMTKMAEEYIECWKDMNGRAPGFTCGSGIFQLSKKRWDEVKYNTSGGGCGASMRAMCIGLKYYGEDKRNMLVALGIESGRLTHNHPTGFMGSLVSAVFTAFAMEDIPCFRWGHLFMKDILPRAKEYTKEKKRDYEDIEKDLSYFEEHFEEFLKDRNISDGNNKDVKYEEDFLNDVDERFDYWEKFSYSGWPGGSGDDSVIIAYDCILMSGDRYDDIVKYSCWHGGDSDSTGTIACAWWGAIYGMKGVYELNIQNLEKRKEIERLAKVFCGMEDEDEEEEEGEEGVKKKESDVMKDET